MAQQVAIISDIHANLSALKAVLEDIQRIGIKDVWCLGDIVGYGPQPLECYQLVMQTCSIVIKGNHELALLPGGGERFNSRAKNAIDWTRQKLASSENGSEILKKIADLPVSFHHDGILFAHGSPAEPTTEYLLPRDAANKAKMQRQFDLIEGYAFVGHTHFPGVIEQNEAFVRPEDMLANIYMLDYDVKAIINVGSVGQPRDKNPAACYVTFGGDSVVYRRVNYDVDATRKKIYMIPQLDDFLGDRLAIGK